MKLTYYLKAIISVTLLLGLIACSDSGTGSLPGDLTGESVDYELSSVDESSINGNVLFEERMDGFTRVTVELSGLDEDTSYLVKFYAGTALDDGDLLVELDSLDGDTGEIVQILSADEEGNTVTYEDLLELDAHIRVYEEDNSEATLAVIDIGKNALTGETHEFELEEVNGSGVNGEIEFKERKSGKILAVIKLDSSVDAETFAARLYENGEENGDLLFEFYSFDGESGMSKTNMAELDNGESIEFEDLGDLEALLHIYNNDDIVSLAEIVFESDSD